MSRLERAMMSRSSNVKYRKPHHDLAAQIAFLLEDDVDHEGKVWPARYRHEAHARRHILMDEQSKGLRRDYARAARRYYKADCREQLAECLQERAEARGG